MSTKTTFKRVALVAVASMGFGMLSVVPSNATDLTVDQCTALTATPFYASTVVGTAATNVATITTSAGTVADACAVTATVSSAPIGSVATPTLTIGTAANANYTLAQTSAAVVTLTKAGTPAGQTGEALGTLSFTPDVAGKYVIKMTPKVTAVTAGALANSAGVAYLTVYATGTGATVASAGVGTATITGVVGGQAQFNYVPALTTNALTAATVWTVANAGTGTITTASGLYATVPTASAGTADAMTAISGAWGTSTGSVAPTNGSTADFSAGVSLSNGSRTTPHVFSFTASSSAAGTQTISINAISATTGAPTLVKTVTITWGTAAVAGSLSTAFLNTSGTYAASNETGPSVAKAASTAVGANIGVTLKDASGNALIGQKLTVSVAGPGAVVIHPLTVAEGSLLDYDATGGALTTAGVRGSTDTTANVTNLWYIGISADGTAGTSTITISVGTTVIATKTLTFYDVAATVSVVQVYSVARAGSTGYTLGSSVTNELSTDVYVAAVYVNVTDSAANDVAATVTCLPTDITVISGCTISADSGTYGYGTGGYVASVTSAPNGVSGASTTVVFRTQLASGAYVTSAPVTFTLGGSIASTVVTLDKSSYLPGEAMVLTVVGKDSSANTTYDGQAMAYSIASNKPVGGALPSAAGKFALGKKATSATSPTLYAPALEGPFTITVTGNEATYTKVTASGTVEGGTATAAANAATDAAAEATDAANAATDAANAAAEAADAATAAAQDASDAVAALSAQVATLIAGLKAQLTALTNLVIKIQKKVKA
jgi:hypothetical protein